MMRIAATLVFCALVCVSGKTNANDPIVDGLAYVRKSEMNAELKNIDAALPPRFNGSEIASDCKDGDSRAVCIPKANQTYVASSYNPATGWHNRSYITCNNNVSASRALPSSAPTSPFSRLFTGCTLSLPSAKSMRPASFRTAKGLRFPAMDPLLPRFRERAFGPHAIPELHSGFSRKNWKTITQ